MATVTTPTSTLIANGRLGASLTEHGILPEFIREPLALWVIPALLRDFNRDLGGPALGAITRKQAQELYECLTAVHSYVDLQLARFPKRPWIVRKTLAWKLRALASENDKLSSIIETLAWATDDELRDFIDSAVDQIKNRDQRSLELFG